MFFPQSDPPITIAHSQSLTRNRYFRISIDIKRRKRAASIIKVSQYVGTYLEANGIPANKKLIHDINNSHKSIDGINVLMAAVNKGHEKEVRLLLDIVDR